MCEEADVSVAFVSQRAQGGLVPDRHHGGSRGDRDKEVKQSATRRYIKASPGDMKAKAESGA